MFWTSLRDHDEKKNSERMGEFIFFLHAIRHFLLFCKGKGPCCTLPGQQATDTLALLVSPAARELLPSGGWKQNARLARKQMFPFCKYRNQLC